MSPSSPGRSRGPPIKSVALLSDEAPCQRASVTIRLGIGVGKHLLLCLNRVFHKSIAIARATGTVTGYAI